MDAARMDAACMVRLSSAGVSVALRAAPLAQQLEAK